MIRNKFLDTTHLKLLIVDEADQMLDRGFVDNIKEILQSIPGDV
jgi:superfamily II DNA/RNA helicase